MNGIEPISATRRIRGDSASNNGFANRRDVERVKMDEVVWSSSGRCLKCREVIMAITRMTSENKRSLDNQFSGRRYV